MEAKLSWIRVVVLGIGASLLAGCGTFTGIPSHGGGKRFAVEQELIAASARAAAKEVDVTPLIGKRCALYVINMGDEGGGNLIGGRYEWQAAIRGEYVNSPTVRTNYSYPVVPTTTTTETSDIVTTTEAENAINAPSRSRQSTEGTDSRVGGGLVYSGPGMYRAEAFINPLDAQFLRAVIHEAFMLKGVVVVPPERAEVDVYVTVDVFGTHRSRTELHAYNEEKLLAKTAFQVTGFDRQRQVVLKPTVVSWEAEYTEKYVAWIGPMATDKRVRRSQDLLVDFQDIVITHIAPADGQLPVPPTHGEPPVPPQERTRPQPPITPLPVPDPSRPEDVKK